MDEENNKMKRLACKTLGIIYLLACLHGPRVLIQLQTGFRKKTWGELGNRRQDNSLS